MSNLNIMRHIVVILVSLSSACAVHSDEMNSRLRLTAQSLIENPEPLPEFIMNVSADSRITFMQAQCVIINQRPFWDASYSAEELLDHLLASVRFTIDTKPVLTSNIEHMWANSAFPVRDSVGNVLGFYGGPITICIDTQGLDPGLHISAIYLTDVSGQEYSYEWAFRHEEDLQDKLPTLAVMPSLPPPNQ